MDEYARKLGLNEVETDDLITSTIPQIKSPYVLVSFYDQKTSEQILPISFSPKPDTYQNIVFYLKRLVDKPNFEINPPYSPRLLKEASSLLLKSVP